MTKPARLLGVLLPFASFAPGEHDTIYDFKIAKPFGPPTLFAR